MKVTEGYSIIILLLTGSAACGCIVLSGAVCLGVVVVVLLKGSGSELVLCCVMS